MEILLPVMSGEEVAFFMQDASIWQENIDWLKDAGLLKNDITPEDLMANVMN